MPCFSSHGLQQKTSDADSEFRQYRPKISPKPISKCSIRQFPDTGIPDNFVLTNVNSFGPSRYDVQDIRPK